MSMQSSISPFARLALRKWMPIGTSMAAFACMFSITAPAEAAVVSLDLTNTGTPGQNITGVNYGFGSGTLGGGPKVVNDWFPGGANGDLAVRYLPGNELWNGLNTGGGLKIAITGGNVSSKAYALNELISSTGVTWSDNWSETLFNYAPGGTQQKRASIGPGNYLGLQSQVGADYYYGWIELTWNPDEGTSGVARLLSAAYETTPNLPIAAGSFTSVPGPLPIIGVAAAYAHSRRLRARLRTGSATKG